MSLPISFSVQKTPLSPVASEPHANNMNVIQKEISRKVKKAINYILNQPLVTSHGWINNDAIFDRIEHDLVYVKKYVTRLAHEKGSPQAKEQAFNRTLVDLTSLVEAYGKLKDNASSPEVAERLKNLKGGIEESIRLVRVCKRVLNPNASFPEESAKETKAETIDAAGKKEVPSVKEPAAAPKDKVAINRDILASLSNFIKIIHNSEAIFDSYEDLYDSSTRGRLKELLQAIDPAEATFPQQLTAVMNVLFADLAANFSSNLPIRTLSEQNIIRVAIREAFEYLAKHEDNQFLRTNGNDEAVKLFLRQLLKVLIDVENEAATNNFNYKSIMMLCMQKFMEKSSPEYVKAMNDLQQMNPSAEEFSFQLLTFAQKLQESLEVKSTANLNSLKDKFALLHSSLFPKLLVPEVPKDDGEWQRLVYAMHTAAAKQAKSALLDTSIDQLDWEWNFLNNFEIALNHSSMRIISQQKMKMLIQKAYEYGQKDGFSMRNTLQGLFGNLLKTPSKANQHLANIINEAHNPVFDWSVRSNEAMTKQMLAGLKEIISAFNYEHVVIPNSEEYPLLITIRRLLMVAQETPFIEQSLQAEAHKQLLINLQGSQPGPNKKSYEKSLGARLQRFLTKALHR